MCAFAALLLLLTGCGNGKKHEPGRVETITTAQLVEKMDNQENLVVVFTQTGCGHCKTFMKMLEDYLPDHNLVLYDVVIDTESDYEGAMKQLTKRFPDFTGTPDINYVEKGELKSRFWSEKETLSEKTFDAWVETHDLLGWE